MHTDRRDSDTVSDTRIVLGPWVEVHTERCRGGRESTIIVNRRDGVAMRLDDGERAHLIEHARGPTDLSDALASNGFLANVPAPADPPKRNALLDFLRTFDSHWTGVDRVIAALHDRCLYRAWRARWFALQVLVAIVGVIATVAAFGSGRDIHLRLSPMQIPGYIALSLLAVAVHELAHGLVISHHGRKVRSVGFRLHLGSPAFYVDSVEALLLTRRQRMLQAVAGVWAEWQFTSLIAVVLWCAPTGAATPVLQRFVVLTAFTIATNLLPFSGLDGALLLADLIGEPHLATESKDAARRVLYDRRPGDTALIAYALMNTLVSASLFAMALWFWYLLFGGLLIGLAGHGPLGWTGVAALITVSFGPAVAGLLPLLRRVTIVDRVLFRIERRHRVKLTEQFAAVAPFDALDDRALSILAGQLQMRRVGRSTPLHEPTFDGYVTVDTAIELASGARLDMGDVIRVERDGISATRHPPFAPAHAGLLPTASIRHIGDRDLNRQLRQSPP